MGVSNVSSSRELLQPLAPQQDDGDGDDSFVPTALGTLRKMSISLEPPDQPARSPTPPGLPPPPPLEQPPRMPPPEQQQQQQQPLYAGYGALPPAAQSSQSSQGSPPGMPPPSMPSVGPPLSMQGRESPPGICHRHQGSRLRWGRRRR